MFDRIDLDLLTRTALGLDSLDETPFCPATFFNFQNRLFAHFIRTGENLLGWVFDDLTAEQLETLKVKTNIQRCDSFMVMSNIRSYSRTQLLVEMLIRLHRSLTDQDKERFNDVLAPYIKQSSGQYIYKLERSDIPHKLEKDGAYGSPDNDKKMEQLGITHIQPAVRGRKAAVAMQIEQTTDGQYTVRALIQCVSSQETRKRYKACFDVEICKQCSLSGQCPTKRQDKGRVYYFDRTDYLRGKRNRDIESLPPETVFIRHKESGLLSSRHLLLENCPCPTPDRR